MSGTETVIAGPAVAGPWAAALDEFERRLHAFRLVLDDDLEPIDTPWPPPEVAGHPLPADLAPRARALLARAAELEEAIRLRREDIHLKAAFGHRPLRSASPSRHAHLADL